MKKLRTTCCLSAALLFSSCYVTKTYDIKDNYNQTIPLDGPALYMQQKIQSLITVIGQQDNPRLNAYVLNGHLFTLKMKRKNAKKVEQLVTQTLCVPGKTCSVVSSVNN